MKMDRKLFLKSLAFAGGGTVGLMTSPAPWQLVRDLARWTQNWPWVPVPPHGKPSFVKSTCGMCSGGCGIIIRKIDERMVRVEGNSHHPVNRGYICPLGLASLQMVYGPARIQQPLKRDGARGEGKWKPISWQEAIGELAGVVRNLRAEQQSHTVACITTSADNTTNELLERFLRAIGSESLVKMNSGKDARNAVLKLMHGIDGDLAYDFEHTDLILSFGSSLLEGWGTCGRMYGTMRSWYQPDADAPEVIQIESNYSTTASKAATWVPIAPATEAALALGIAHVLVSEGSYDKKFVEKHCFGFEDWEDSDGKKHGGFKNVVLSEYSPPSVEKISGVSVKQIESLAHKFAAARPALAVGGGGRGEHFNGIYELMAVHSLNALVGNINAEGGVLVKSRVPLKPMPDVEMDEESRRGCSAGRLDKAGGEHYPFSSSLPGGLNAADIKLLIINETNPFYLLPERQVAEQLFETVPYIVSMSPYLDESAARADLVLPTSTWFERWDDQFVAPELQYAIYNLNHPVIEPLYQTKSTGDIVLETAREIGDSVSVSFPWPDMQQLLRERARGLYESGGGIIDSPDLRKISESTVSDIPSYSSFSAMWEKLQQNTCWFNPKYDYGDPRKLLKTPSGKFEFYSQALRNAFHFEDDKLCLPHYVTPRERPKELNILIMTQNTLLLGDGGKGTPPFLMKQLEPVQLKGDALFVTINPITAMYQNLEEGEEVLLESSAGKIPVRLHLYEGVREGVALIPLGFGHSAFDEFVRGKGVNAMRVVAAEKDSVTGLPLWRVTPGKITKA